MESSKQRFSPSTTIVGMGKMCELKKITNYLSFMKNINVLDVTLFNYFTL